MDRFILEKDKESLDPSKFFPIQEKLSLPRSWLETLAKVDFPPLGSENIILESESLPLAAKPVPPCQSPKKVKKKRERSKCICWHSRYLKVKICKPVVQSVNPEIQIK